MKRLSLMVILATGAVVPLGHSIAHGVLGPSEINAACPGTSPKAAVHGYYAAVLRHDAHAARSCLTPQYRTRLARVLDPDWQNIASIQALKLKREPASYASLPGSSVPTAYLKPAAVAQIDVEFSVHYYHEQSSSNGSTIRFIYVVKQHRNSPWRIASIGSGP